MNPSRRLATWIDAHNPYQEHLTHLKLQKLMFYCAGLALAFDHDIGDIPFEPWEHGPVNREVWRHLRRYGAKQLPHGAELRAVLQAGEHRITYGTTTDRTLLCALKIYGSLSAWSLRCQTHLEGPWKEAYEAKSDTINSSAIRAHFVKKYRQHRVSCPEWVLDPGSFKIDGLPVHSYPSIETLAESVYRSATSA
jgi:uncharacterized phage-associated protein